MLPWRTSPIPGPLGPFTYPPMLEKLLKGGLVGAGVPGGGVEISCSRVLLGSTELGLPSNEFPSTCSSSSIASSEISDLNTCPCSGDCVALPRSSGGIPIPTLTPTPEARVLGVWVKFGGAGAPRSMPARAKLGMPSCAVPPRTKAKFPHPAPP
jgi:hypothetical protein